MNILRITGMSLLLCMPLQGVQASDEDGVRDSWRFRVYLDDRPIGFHEFRLSGEPGRQTVHINAEFDVSFMFLNVYRYRHENTEHWKGDCLQDLSSRTDDDGDTYRVRLEKTDGETVIESGSGRQRVEYCVRSFAYWNRALLDSGRLLNAQTGEIIDVSLYRVQRSDTPRLHYRLSGTGINIDLWYSPDGEWQGLQSKTEDGYTLRYTLEDPS